MAEVTVPRVSDFSHKRDDECRFVSSPEIGSEQMALSINPVGGHRIPPDYGAEAILYFVSVTFAS